MNPTLPRLLVVDDEEPIMRLLLEFFEDFGEFRVQGVGSGEEGLEALTQEPADACIVDMRLADMDGEAFILAANERKLCPRFVLHTGSVDLSLSDELCRAGITNDDVFIKPTDLDLLLAHVRTVMQSRKA